MWRDVYEDFSELTKSEQIASFYWRHKILNALGSLGFNQLQGIVESDETFFRESLKGKREITHRKAKKRREKDEKRGISNLKIAVVAALKPRKSTCRTNAYFSVSKIKSYSR